MEEWVRILVSVALGLLVYAISAIGCASLSFLWLPRLPRPSAALLASLVMPAIAAAILLALFMSDSGGPSPGEFLIVLVITCMPGLVVGWPFAFFTLRALERRIERAGIKASEIFE